MPVSYFFKAFAVIVLILGIFFPVIKNYNRNDNSIVQTCRFVYVRIVPVNKNLKDWLQECSKQARKLYSENAPLDRQLKLGNAILDELKISHLELFSQKESEAIWTDTDFENGIEARFIDGELVITRVYPKSQGQKRGLQRGDRIALEKNETLSSYELNRWKGPLKIIRKNKSFQVDLKPEELSIQRDMAVTKTQGFKVLSIESFKSQYFGDEKIKKIKSELKKTDRVIIDLRGNNGGNFVAGLRLLSAFMCQPTIVGYMKKTHNLGRTGFFEDNLEDDYQINTLSKFDSVALKTFENKTCFPKPEAVLIDAYSKSTSEWVALAFREIQSVPIYGSTSAGELLVGIWYDISHIWGHVVKLSIPEAYYESKKGFQIEAQGVSADKTLYPARTDYEQGLDSEIIQTIKALQ